MQQEQTGSIGASLAGHLERDAPEAVADSRAPCHVWAREEYRNRVGVSAFRCLMK